VEDQGLAFVLVVVVAVAASGLCRWRGISPALPLLVVGLGLSQIPGLVGQVPSPETVLVFLLAGVALLAWRSPSPYERLMATAGFTWLALTYLAFLLYALLYRDSWISHCLRWSWLRGLGIIAYGTYLFHEFFLGMFFGRIPWLRSWHDVGLSV